MSNEIYFHEPMSKHTSWKVGGPADIFYLPKSLEELSQYFKKCSQDQPIFWCGLGSNILVRDAGIRGVVIGTQRFLNQIEVLEESMIRAEVGVSCATFARFCARKNLTGIEFLAGIPGTVGGALAMNAGCHGGETWPHVAAVEMMNRQGQINIFPKEEFSYTYRHVEIPRDHWFVAAHFHLTRGDKEKSLQTIRELLDYRARTQPIDEPSGGSTFRNPPHDFAARLIEIAGLKGFKIGNAMVSPKHANFIVNLGGALAKDIETLILHIQKEVHRQCGVELILEVKIVGEEK